MGTIGVNMWPWPTEADLKRLVNRHMAVRIQAHQPYGWEPVDFYLNKCRELGVLCVPILKWDRPRPQTDSEWGDWHNFLGEAVKRYPWQRWWQVWNEPNNKYVPVWNFPDPATYRYFINDSAQYMKIINRNVKIIAGGIACGGHGSRHAPADFNYKWFHQTWAVDRVAIHTYCSTVDGAVNAINRARYASSVPIWCTELGRKAKVDGERRQASWFRQIHNRTAGVPKFWFRFSDAVDDPIFNTFGAWREDETARPVWKRLYEAVGA